MFLPFSRGARECDVARVVLAFVDTQGVVGDVVGVLEGLCGTET